MAISLLRSCSVRMMDDFKWQDIRRVLIPVNGRKSSSHGGGSESTCQREASR